MATLEKLQPHIAYRLALAHSIFKKAVDFCKIQNDPYSFSHGLIALHDALDNFTGAIASQLNIALPQESKLLTAINLIQEHERQSNKSIAFEGAALPDVLSKGVFDYDPDMQLPSMQPAQMAEMIKKGFEQAKMIAQGMSDGEWEGSAVMTMKGKEVWKSTKGEMALGFVLDLIHHRGQLSVYLRPMGSKVPSIYGPTADTQ